MRKLPVFVVALLLGLAAIGCDSNEDDESDAELIVGTWNLVSIADSTGDQTQGFAGLAESLTVEFTGDGEFELNLNYREDSGRDDVLLPGDYTIDDGTEELTMLLPAIQQSMVFDYNFENDDELELTTGSDIVNAIFNPTTEYQGQVEIVVRRL